MMVFLISTTYVLTYFLPAGSAHFWLRGVEVPNDKSGFIYFVLFFYQLRPHIFWCSVVGALHIKDCHVFWKKWLLYHHVMPSSSLVAFLTMKTFLSEITIATLAFFWLMLAWYIFLYPRTSNLHASSHLNWISYRQHLVDLVFWPTLIISVI